MNFPFRRQPHSRLGDEELITLIASKDAAAFEAFYDRHGGAAYSLAYRITGEQQIAEDVTQEALISIWRNPFHFDPTRGSARAWMHGVVRNRSIDAIRKRASAKAPRLRFEEVELEKQSSGDRTDSEVVRRETANELHERLEHLPGDQRKALELAYFGGFTQDEIADLMDAPLGTVKGRMRLGLEKLRAEFTEAAR